MPGGLINIAAEIRRLERSVDDKLWNGEPHEHDERELAHLRELEAKGDIWLPTF